jgi:hypothetical protein
MRRVVGLVVVLGVFGAGAWFRALSPASAPIRHVELTRSMTHPPALGQELQRLVVGTVTKRKGVPHVTLPNIHSQTCNVATACSLVPCVVYTAGASPAVYPQVPNVAVRPQATCSHKPARALPVVAPSVSVSASPR